jgi:glycosyltransferase involved in cell wall biosynthesis
MGLPIVSTRIPGCVDSVKDGVTGMLVPPRDVDTLIQAIQAYLDDPELRRRHGQAGRERVVRDFRPESIWEDLYKEYWKLLKKKRVV